MTPTTTTLLPYVILALCNSGYPVSSLTMDGGGGIQEGILRISKGHLRVIQVICDFIIFFGLGDRPLLDLVLFSVALHNPIQKWS